MSAFNISRTLACSLLLLGSTSPATTVMGTGSTATELAWMEQHWRCVWRGRGLDSWRNSSLAWALCVGCSSEMSWQDSLLSKI